MTTTATPLKVHQLPEDKILVVFHRVRNEERHQEMTNAIEDIGIKSPAQVFSIKHWPTERRRDPRGRVCDWGLVSGEGRLLATRKLKRKTLPCVLVPEATAREIVRRHWSENFERHPLKWSERGLLIRDEMRMSGDPVAKVAERWKISPNLAAKYVRVLNHAGEAGIEEDVAAMTVNDAEVITTLPPNEQRIVMHIVKDTGADVQEVAREARELAKSKGSDLTLQELKAHRERFDTQLERLRKRARLLRRDFAIGPQNIMQLLERPSVRKKLERKGINYSRFLDVMNRKP